MKTVFLDFDGVLFDTVLESYLLARYAYYGIEPQETVDENEYNIFHSVRYLITNSWHYYYIMKLLSEKISINNFAQEYKKLLDNRDIDAALEFDKKFQTKRKDLMNNNFDFWNSLDKPYPFFYEIKKIQNQYNFVIVSTKNEEAILKHCKDYGLKINKTNIVGKTKLAQFGTKKEFLEYYINTNNITKSIFIDDAIITIKKCSNIQNLTAICANWGYVADKNDGLSEKEIFNIIKEM